MCDEREALFIFCDTLIFNVSFALSDLLILFIAIPFHSLFSVFFVHPSFNFGTIPSHAFCYHMFYNMM